VFIVREFYYFLDNVEILEYSPTQSDQSILTLFPVYFSFFFGKLTYVLKEEDTNIIRGIPQIYNNNRNIKQQMATG
jgi:hypothetical protein